MKTKLAKHFMSAYVKGFAAGTHGKHQCPYRHKASARYWREGHEDSVSNKEMRYTSV